MASYLVSEVVIPANTSPGDVIRVVVGSQVATLSVPAGARPGELLQFRLGEPSPPAMPNAYEYGGSKADVPQPATTAARGWAQVAGGQPQPPPSKQWQDQQRHQPQYKQQYEQLYQQHQHQQPQFQQPQHQQPQYQQPPQSALSPAHSGNAIAAGQSIDPALLALYNARNNVVMVGREVIGSHTRGCGVCGHNFNNASAGQMYWAGMAGDGTYLKFCSHCFGQAVKDDIPDRNIEAMRQQGQELVAKREAAAAEREEAAAAAREEARVEATKAEERARIARQAELRKTAERYIEEVASVRREISEGSKRGGGGAGTGKRAKTVVELDRLTMDARLEDTSIEGGRVVGIVYQKPKLPCSVCRKEFSEGTLRYGGGAGATDKEGLPVWCAPCLAEALGGVYVVRKHKCPMCDEKSEDFKLKVCGGDCGEDIGCQLCWYDHSYTCEGCEVTSCHNCGGGEMCDECSCLYCRDCTTMKPGKNKTQRCSDCQPWWQKNKPASAFCRDCGSQRSGARFVGGDRICHECDDGSGEFGSDDDD